MRDDHAGVVTSVDTGVASTLFCVRYQHLQNLLVKTFDEVVLAGTVDAHQMTSVHTTDGFRSDGGRGLLVQLVAAAVVVEIAVLALYTTRKRATPENRGIQKMESDYKNVKTGRQCMYLREKNEFHFFHFPIFGYCPKRGCIRFVRTDIRGIPLYVTVTREFSFSVSVKIGGITFCWTKTRAVAFYAKYSVSIFLENVVGM